MPQYIICLLIASCYSILLFWLICSIIIHQLVRYCWVLFLERPVALRSFLRSVRLSPLLYLDKTNFRIN